MNALQIETRLRKILASYSNLPYTQATKNSLAEEIAKEFAKEEMTAEETKYMAKRVPELLFGMDACEKARKPKE